MNQQVHVYYTGRVQGVGFRFTAESLARESGITGWVKNLRDGRVEIVAEGQDEDLISFLDKIGRSFAQYISDTQVQWLEASDSFKDFSVKF